jgi:RNA polymerase sigma-70 factor (ECF subfamily)
MCFQASREDARLNADGSINLLKFQDRSRWNKDLIEKGKFFLEHSTDEEEISAYHLEAAIAGSHSAASSFETTDWKRIVHLYSALADIKPGPIVELNRAIALGYAKSSADGLAALQKITGLQNHYLFHAAMGDFYFDLDDSANARQSYLQAMSLTTSSSEKRLLRKKLESLPTATST